MTTDLRKAAIALAALPLLGGCVHSMFEEPGDSTFGEANRQTLMAQVVDPDPIYDGDMVSSGDHAADAIARYHSDTVTQPDSIKTTDVGSGSGPS